MYVKKQLMVEKYTEKSNNELFNTLIRTIFILTIYNRLYLYFLNSLYLYYVS